MKNALYILETYRTKFVLKREPFVGTYKEAKYRCKEIDKDSGANQNTSPKFRHHVE